MSLLTIAAVAAGAYAYSTNSRIREQMNKVGSAVVDLALTAKEELTKAAAEQKKD